MAWAQKRHCPRFPHPTFCSWSFLFLTLLGWIQHFQAGSISFANWAPSFFFDWSLWIKRPAEETPFYVIHRGCRRWWGSSLHCKKEVSLNLHCMRADRHTHALLFKPAPCLCLCFYDTDIYATEEAGLMVGLPSHTYFAFGKSMLLSLLSDMWGRAA